MQQIYGKNTVGPLDPRAKALVKSMGEVSIRLSQLAKELRTIRRRKRGGAGPRRAIQDLLAGVAHRLNDSFRDISGSEFVQSITVSHGDISPVSLSVRCILRNGTICTPQQILSEANLDLLSLLFFLAAAKESAARGQAKVLILDDVLQSVDAGIRVSVVDYMLREFSDWQLIVSLHDRLWWTQLRELCRRHRHEIIEREIVRWEFDLGPTLLQGRDMVESLVTVLDAGDRVAICSRAGILLEAICSRLSWTLPVSVTRRKDDRYTLGQLWPAICKALSGTSIRTTTIDVEKWLHLRNLLGAHYNEWAQSASTHEAQSFGKSVLRLYQSTHCSRCFQWIERSHESDKKWLCRCGQTVVEKI